MRFRLGRRVAFLTADGVEFSAKPFFYTNGGGGRMQIDLYADNGTPLKCVDEEKGLYSLGESGKMVYLKTDPPFAC